MKKIKSLIVLLVVMTLLMTCFVACRPEDGEDDWSNDGGTTVEKNDGEDVGDDGEAGENEAGNNSSDEKEDNKTDDKENGTNDKGNGTNDKGNGTNDKENGGTTQGGNGEYSGNSEMAENPLMNPAKKPNFKATCSFDIDKTGFAKGTVADMKGKTLTVFTGVDYSMFGYHTTDGKGNDGTTYIQEWKWFKELKKAYGLTVKYVRCGPGNNVIKPFQAMSAGKDCDIITTHVASFPYVCNILAPLDQYANFNNFSKSPGLDPMITEVTTWKNHPVALGPCLTNGTLCYDKTYIKSCGLDDPRELFEKGEWNWTNFKKYMVGLPDTTKKGQQVIGMSTWGQYYYWAATNGKTCFEIDGKDPNGGIINNWDTTEVKETYIWLESVVDAGGYYWNGSCPGWFSEDPKYYAAMTYSNMGWIDYVDLAADNKTVNEMAWVPFPKNEKNPNGLNHVEIYGYGIGLPRKTNKEGNRTAAMKFAELWCNRYTESRYDRYRNRCKWTYEQIVEYYEYGKKYGRMGLGSGVGTFSNHMGKNTNWSESITSASFSTAACHEKASNYAKQEIANVLKFGVQ